MIHRILNLPSFIRYPLAKLISKILRASVAKAIYKEMDENKKSSPILKLTKIRQNIKVLIRMIKALIIRFLLL